MTLTQKINEKGYTLANGMVIGGKFIPDNGKTKPKYSLCVKTPDGKWHDIVGKPEQTITFGTGDDKITTTLKEIMFDFFKMDEEEKFQYLHGMSRKTFDYIEKAKKEEGLLYMEKADEDESITKYRENVFLNEGPCGRTIYFEKENENRYKALYHSGEFIYNMKFDHKPETHDINVVNTIISVIMEIKYSHCLETYQCAHCGKTIHWTESEGNIIEKWRKYQREMCCL